MLTSTRKDCTTEHMIIKYMFPKLTHLYRNVRVNSDSNYEMIYGLSHNYIRYRKSHDDNVMDGDDDDIYVASEL